MKKKVIRVLLVCGVLATVLLIRHFYLIYQFHACLHCLDDVENARVSISSRNTDEWCYFTDRMSMSSNMPCYPIEDTQIKEELFALLRQNQELTRIKVGQYAYQSLPNSYEIFVHSDNHPLCIFYISTQNPETLIQGKHQIDFYVSGGEEVATYLTALFDALRSQNSES